MTDGSRRGELAGQSRAARPAVTLAGSVTIILPACTPADARVPVAGPSGQRKTDGALSAGHAAPAAGGAGRGVSGRLVGLAGGHRTGEHDLRHERAVPRAERRLIGKSRGRSAASSGREASYRTAPGHRLSGGMSRGRRPTSWTPPGRDRTAASGALARRRMSWCAGIRGAGARHRQGALARRRRMSWCRRRGAAFTMTAPSTVSVRRQVSSGSASYSPASSALMPSGKAIRSGKAVTGFLPCPCAVSPEGNRGDRGGRAQRGSPVGGPGRRVP